VVGSTSSASNVHEAANDNTNPYRNMVMDAMRMNQGNVNQCPIIEEEPNADAVRFFNLLKDSDEPLWDGCTNHSKLSALAHVFTIKSNHGLSETGYDKIIEWTRSILPEGNRLKENFYAAKSMMKPLCLDCHRRFLPLNHRYRKNRKDFFIGRVEKDVASPCLSGEELHDVVLKYGDIMFDFQLGK